MDVHQSTISVAVMDENGKLLTSETSFWAAVEGSVAGGCRTAAITRQPPQARPRFLATCSK
jgi:hypothetical protein